MHRTLKIFFSSSTNHLWNAKAKEQPRRAVKKIHFFELQNTFFSFFFILIPLTSSVHNFLQKKHFKLSDLNCFEIVLLSFLVFFPFLSIFSAIDAPKRRAPSTPTWGGHNFLAFCSFLSIFSAIDAPRGGLHLLFEHHKQWIRPSCKNNKQTLPYLKW